MSGIQARMLGWILQRQEPVLKLQNTYSSIKKGDMILLSNGGSRGTKVNPSTHGNHVLTSSRAATLKQVLDDLILYFVQSDSPR